MTNVLGFAAKVGIALAAVVLLAACGGDASGEVTVESHSNEDFSGGTFTATGDLVCAGGEFATLDFEFTETLWTFEDAYTCADGSGSFVIGAELPLDPNFEEGDEPEPLEGTWTVIRGTGDYEDLAGGGTLVSTLFIDSTEKYTGELKNG